MKIFGRLFGANPAPAPMPPTSPEDSGVEKLEALAMRTPAEIKHNPPEDRIPFYKQFLKSTVLWLTPSGSANKWDIMRWGELEGHPVIPIFSSMDNVRAFIDASREQGLPSGNVLQGKGVGLFGGALLEDWIVFNPASEHSVAFTLGQVAYHVVDKRVFESNFDHEEFSRAIDRIADED
jgi:hypothetical protein